MLKALTDHCSELILLSPPPIVIGSPDDVDDLFDLYNTTFLGLLNKHAPEKEKVVPDRPSSVDKRGCH